MKNKVIILFLAVIFSIGMLLCGCGGQSADNEADTSSASSAENQSNESEAGESGAGVEDMGDRLAKVYTDMMQSGKYYMKYRATFEMEGQKEEAQIEVAVNGDDSAMISTMSAGKSHMVFQDNKTYFIDNESKSVMVMNSPDIEMEDDAEIDTDGLTYKGNGDAEFLGKNLPYEEYSTESGSIKYYFDGKKLVGMEVLAEGMTQVMEVLEMSEDYPAEIFTIPADYTIEEMPY
ncbi:MAG: hypothetical protein PHT78_03110 [Desulfitobacteriaceae bacterium]|nr:hypothetical protein [Desulfitobacteriaceae bacterium]MDD4752230.1 hypothetical protein [Desulfitobacteriaceae bacterium]